MADAAVAILLLAAGASRRMGQPKQLLAIQGQPLLRHVVAAALGPEAGPFLVVLGAAADAIEPCLASLPIQVVRHEGWAEGMGSSLRAGMRALRALQLPTPGVIVALADQPNFSRATIQRLLAGQRRTAKTIVATEHNATWAPPVYFAERYFPELEALAGDAGARALLARYPAEVATVREDLMVDLDTPYDYAAFRLKATAAAGTEFAPNRTDLSRQVRRNAKAVNY